MSGPGGIPNSADFPISSAVGREFNQQNAFSPNPIQISPIQEKILSRINEAPVPIAPQRKGRENSRN